MRQQAQMEVERSSRALVILKHHNVQAARSITYLLSWP